MTNREKFEKEFGYDGSIVSKAKPEYLKFGSCGYDHCTESCASRCFPRCPMWWDDEEFSKNYKFSFSNDDMGMILQYQKAVGAATIQSAIMNAISLALDHADD